MNERYAPQPMPMPVDKERWLSELHLSNFHNAYYQYRDVRSCVGGAGRLLIVGPGQGLDTAVFRSQGYEVVTYDIDSDFKPDVLGSVHAMPHFGDGAFDVVIASHVLEHISRKLLPSALSELARVARFALVYLPYAGRHVDASFTQFQGSREHHLRVNIAPFWRTPSDDEARFAGGQHYWEVGVRGCSPRVVRKWFESRFDVLSSYQNPHWLVSMNYVLRSRQNSKKGSA